MVTPASPVSQVLAAVRCCCVVAENSLSQLPLLAPLLVVVSDFRFVGCSAGRCLSALSLRASCSRSNRRSTASSSSSSPFQISKILWADAFTQPLVKVFDLHNRFKQYVLAPRAKTQVSAVRCPTVRRGSIALRSDGARLDPRSRMDQSKIARPFEKDGWMTGWADSKHS